MLFRTYINPSRIAKEAYRGYQKAVFDGIYDIIGKRSFMEYKFGMLDVMFPVIENICEIITFYTDEIDKLALVVNIDTENKKIDLKPFVSGEEEPPKGEMTVGAFGNDIYKCNMPQEALLVYLYDAVMVLVKEKERENGLQQ